MDNNDDLNESAAACAVALTEETRRPHLAYEIVGGLGSAAILFAYFGLTNDWIAEGPLFHGLNLVGAIGVGAVCLRKRTWSPLVLEVVWAAVALFGLAKAWA